MSAALVAVVVGLPALRRRGLYLAVTTFAFSLATTSYLLNRRFFNWVPTGRVERHPLLGRIDIDSPTRMYYVSLVGSSLVVVGAPRRPAQPHRTGADRPARERAGRARPTASARCGRSSPRSPSPARSPRSPGASSCTTSRPTAQGPYEPGENFSVFTMAVIGGIGSVPGALLGAFYLLWHRHGSCPPEWRFLVTGSACCSSC